MFVGVRAKQIESFIPLQVKYEISNGPDKVKTSYFYQLTSMPVLRGKVSRNFQISQIGGGKFPGNFLEISINFWPEISGPKTSKH
jgi:hypothetical protein